MPCARVSITETNWELVGVHLDRVTLTDRAPSTAYAAALEQMTADETLLKQQRETFNTLRARLNTLYDEQFARFNLGTIQDSQHTDRELVSIASVVDPQNLYTRGRAIVGKDSPPSTYTQPELARALWLQLLRVDRP